MKAHKKNAVDNLKTEKYQMKCYLFCNLKW